jgi:lipid-A-disaccharide synthase
MNDTGRPRFGMVAGEASGDLLAGLLLGGMKERWPELQSFGIGGPKMQAQGFESWWPHDKLSINGYVQALRNFRELLTMRNQLAARVLESRPDAFIGVDAPDFNLDLELRFKAQGIKAIHFVSPSIWAWRGKRIEKIKRATDLVLCVFPFEPAIYAKQGVPAAYVGHPLADAIPLEPPRAEARAALGFAPDDVVVAVMPGSRRTEIQYIAPRLLGAAALMQRERPGLRFVLPVVPGLRHMVEPVRRQYAPQIDLTLIDGHSHEALAACDVVIAASGTATLEAALFKRPMVITYAMHALSWHMMKGMKYQPWVGLPNILLADFAVPELLQSDATPERIAAEAFKWLDDPAACEVLRTRFAALHLELRRDTAKVATDAIEATLAA